MKIKSGLGTSLALLIPLAVAAQPGNPSFAIVNRIVGPDGNWDYAVADSANRRLYIARDYGVMEVDLDSGAVTGKLIPGSGVHGVAVIGDTGLLISTNGKANTATLFEGKTGKIINEFQAGADPDAAVYEPKSGLIAIINHESGDATLIDPNAKSSVGTIPIGGELEFAAVDGDGYLYVNIADKAEIAVIDIAARRVTMRLPLKGCVEPSGLAYDSDDQLLIASCFNGVAIFLDSKDHRQIALIHTGKIPDAVIFDASRRLVFIPSFTNGNVTVITARDRKNIHAVQTLATQVGTRTGALDTKTGRIYLPTSRLIPPAKEGDYPTPVPGTFEVLVMSAKH